MLVSRVRLFETPWTVATRLLCLWNSPGKNTGVGSHSFLQGIFPTRDGTQVSCIAGRFFTVWASREGTRRVNKIVVFMEKTRRGTTLWVRAIHMYTVNLLNYFCSFIYEFNFCFYQICVLEQILQKSLYDKSRSRHPNPVFKQFLF